MFEALRRRIPWFVGIEELVGVRFPVRHYQAKVSDGLIRGSRLETADDYRRLQAQGVKSIVDLTAEGTKDETEPEAGALRKLRLHIIDNTAPTTRQMERFLAFATDPKNQPVYVHCEAGIGRTGVAVACYRMAVQGWSAEQAISDTSKYGIPVRSQLNFIRSFERKLAEGRISGFAAPAVHRGVSQWMTEPA
jgi:protein-tyrosine phosphatase